MQKRHLGFGRSIKFFISLTLSWQISLGSMPLAFAADPVSSNDIATQLAKNATSKDQRDHIALWDKAAVALESGNVNALPDRDPNPFQLGNQRVDINGITYSFNDYQVEIPSVSFTGLRVTYDEKVQELIFEGLRGQNDRGEAGTVVARHVISNINIVSMIKDEELISLIDENGNLHVIPMDYVAKNIFASPIPVFKNLWSPANDIKADDFELRYASPGLAPPDFADTNVQAVLPRDAEGHVQINAGDLMVYRANGNQRELMGVFSRQVTYEKIIRGFKYLMAMLMQIYPANVNHSVAKKILNGLDSQTNLEISEQDLQTLPDPIRRAFLHFSKLQIDNANASIEQQTNRSNRQFHRLNESDWQKTFNELQQVAIARTKALGEKTDEASTLEKVDIEAMLSSGDLTSIWQKLYKQSSLMPKAKNVNKPQREWLKKMAGVSLKYLSPMFAVGTMWGFPYAYEHSEAMQQIQTLGWMYQHAIPDVVKDLEYRSILLTSTVSLLALWPASVAISWSIGRGLKVAAAAAAKSSNKFAQNLRDLARSWSPLTNWQRITSFGMRFFGTLIYPIMQLPLQLARQPTMASAFSKGLNPFQQITPYSAVGQSIGAKNTFTLGALNPLTSNANRASQRELQLKAQAILAERKLRIENLSWQIAALVVAEKEQVDPATINMLAAGKLNTKNLTTIFSDKNLQRDWESTQETVLDYLKGVDDGYFDEDIKEIKSEMLEKHFAIAQDIVAKVKTQAPSRKTLGQLWRTSRNKVKSAAQYMFNLGLEDSRFGHTVFTNKYVSEQTERGFVSDHIMMALIYALVGERADLTRPENLAATATGFLNTSGPHWSDISMNTYVHFFAASAKRAMVFQKVKPVDSALYEPAEYLWADALDRPEGVLRTSYEWLANVLDPRVSDISHYAIKSQIKKLTTIQAAFVMQMFTRIGIGHQTLDHALLGWAIFFVAAQWCYGWPWDFIDRGTHLEGERIETMRQQFKEAAAAIAQGLREPNQNENQLKIRDGYSRMVELFEKYNPQALQILTKNLSAGSYSQLMTEYNQVFNAQSMRNMGLIVRLNTALRSDNAVEVSKAETAIREALKTGGLMTEEVERMNAQALLDYSLETSPIYTRPHAAPSWVATFGFGAVLTTILSIPLVVSSFDKDFLTVGNLGFWTATSLAGYWAYHKTLGKNGIVAGALNKVDSLQLGKKFDDWKLKRKISCEEKLKRKK